MTTLTPDEYRTLLIRALGNAADANTTEPDPQRLFTPSSHRLALAPDVTVVQGARGTGKTYWAKALTDPQLREIAAAAYMMPRLRQVKVTTGYTVEQEEDAPHPDKRTIAQLMRDKDFKPVEFWFTVVLMALQVPQVVEAGSWAERIRWTRENPEPLGLALRAANRTTREQGLTHVLIFDALDHLHADRSRADELVSGLLEVALELRLAYGALRAKVFIRPDMYESAPKSFADASKLTANTAELSWYRENLYGLLFHQLGNDDSPEAEKFRAATGSWRDDGEGRHIAPVDVIADQGRQEEVFVSLAGPYMGTDRRKGHTYTWVPNHLQDGREQVSPRAWLFSLHEAAVRSAERYAAHPYPLHYDAIRDSLQAASRIRVAELKEDVGWAAAALTRLEGGQVPMEPSVLLQHWEEGALRAALQALGESDEDHGSGPRSADNPLSLIDELVELGVLTRRVSGAVDLPDVYRLAFDIGRKGGVSRNRS